MPCSKLQCGCNISVLSTSAQRRQKEHHVWHLAYQLKINTNVQMFLSPLSLKTFQRLVKSILSTLAQILQPNAMSFFSPDLLKIILQACHVLAEPESN
jgi:hypothetical protein